MKDYRLSEIKKICEEHSTDYDRLCGECPLRNNVCKEIENAPATWEIDEKEYKETVVVLTREECDSKVILDEDHFLRVLDNERAQSRKETALKIRNYIKQHTELGDYYAGECYDELDIWSFDRFLKENFGVEVEE